MERFMFWLYILISIGSLVNGFPYDPDTSARISPYLPETELDPSGQYDHVNGGSVETNELLDILGLSDETMSDDAVSTSSTESTSEKNRFAYPFMVNLYNSMADPMSGLTFGRRPYNATKVRAIPEAGRGGRLGFQFNVSQLGSSVELLQAEFHLYRLRPRWASASPDTRRPNYFQVHVYQLMSPDSSLEGARLIGLRLLSSKGTGWEVFNIRETVQEWINNKTSNYGLYVTVTSLSGHPLPDHMLRFAKRARHDNSRQPILVLFTQENFLRGEENVEASQRSVYQAAESTVSTISFHREPSSEELRRRKRSLAKHRAYVDQNNQSEEATRSSGCVRKNMYVSFEAIGWSRWIIAPKGYDAYRCNGGCPVKSRSRDDYSWSNHAKVQAIMTRRKRGVASPCCVPSDYLPLGLPILYYEPQNGNIVLTEIPEMIVANCGCR